MSSEVFSVYVLFLTRLDFVTTEVFLCLCKYNVLPQFFTVFLEAQLFGRVLSVLARVVYALARLFTHKTDKFALLILFCHIPYILPDDCVSVNSKWLKSITMHWLCYTRVSLCMNYSS